MYITLYCASLPVCVFEIYLYVFDNLLDDIHLYDVTNLFLIDLYVVDSLLDEIHLYDVRIFFFNAHRLTPLTILERPWS